MMNFKLIIIQCTKILAVLCTDELRPEIRFIYIIILFRG